MQSWNPQRSLCTSESAGTITGNELPESEAHQETAHMRRPGISLFTYFNNLQTGNKGLLQQTAILNLEIFQQSCPRTLDSG